MVDLHTHILPGMDDGAKKTSESLKMLSDAYSQGVRFCVATPHFVLHRNSDIDFFISKRAQKYAELCSAAHASRVPLPHVRLGAEIFMDNNINSYPDLSKLCIEGSRCLLVEFPSEKYDPYWGDWLHSLSLKGYIPIIAHFDRYAHREAMLSDFDGVSTVYQLNASRMFSFSGRRLLSTLLEKGVPVVFSSDMHNTLQRPCNLKDAFRKAKQKFPKEADLLFSVRARSILGIKEESR